MAVQISHHYKCIFIHVPKAGGTSIETSSLFEDQRNISGDYVGGHLTASEYRDQFPWEFERYFKFSFVRNPFDRLVSAFFHLNNLRATNKYGKKVYNEYILKYNRDFNKFCISFVDNLNINKVTHFQPQHHFLCDKNGNIIVDFIGKVEDFNRDFNFVKKQINYSGFIGHRLKSKHKYYAHYYNDKTIEIVKKVYWQDLELFGYTFENSTWNQISYLFRDTLIMSQYFNLENFKTKFNNLSKFK